MIWLTFWVLTHHWSKILYNVALSSDEGVMLNMSAKSVFVVYTGIDFQLIQSIGK